MEYPTLPQCFLDAVDRYRSPRMQIHKVGGEWQDIPAREMLGRVARLSNALAELGVRDGDRVAIFAPNCPEWHVADFAVSGLGGVVVPIYFKESPERIAYIVGHAGASVIFVAGEEQAARLASLRGKLTSVEHVIAAAPGMSRTAGSAASGVRPSDTLSSYETLNYETLVGGEIGMPEADADVALYRRRVADLVSRPGSQPSGLSEVGAHRLASIIYTSGTTGEPKGVMLSHANLVSNQIESFEGFVARPDDVALSFLPLAHVYERVADYGFLFQGIPVAYVARPEEVSSALLEVRPTIAAAVPRFFEKLYATVMDRGAQATGFKRRLFDWAIGVARRAIPWKAYGRPVSPFVKMQWRWADKLVYAKFRAGVGGRLRIFISGGAPLATELAEFFMTVGLEICQGYGLTETSPVVTANMANPNRIGTVGKPIRGVEVRIAGDGEILVRGSCVMMGYYKKPEETRAVLSPDGWFATGDIGRLDADGYLIITDRKKELLKTAGGKMVAPAPIENALKGSPYILNAVVIGDKRRFIGALIVPNGPRVEGRAREMGVALGANGDAAGHAMQNPWVRKLIESEIARLTANLAQYETIKRFALLDRDFTFDNGELTYTLKLKRRVIEEHYAGIIEELYAEPSPLKS